MDNSKTKTKLQEVVNLVKQDISTIRTGKANVTSVAELSVSVYGGAQTLKINELANVTSPDTKTIVIDPWDKSIIGDIKKGILVANAGITPSIDGEVIRISFPPLTTEDRKKFSKILSSKIESGKVMIRQVRAEAMKGIRDAFENKELSEDEKFRKEKELQKTIDDFNEQLDQLYSAKEKELLQI